MTEPMSDERLAELYQRAASSGLDYDDAADLLEEVERLRAIVAELHPDWGIRAVTKATGLAEDVPQPSEDSARRRAARGSSTGVLVSRLVGPWTVTE